MCGAAYDAVVRRNACTLSTRLRGGRAYNYHAEKGSLYPRLHVKDFQSSQIADEIADKLFLLSEISLVDIGETEGPRTRSLAKWMPTLGMKVPPAQFGRPEKPRYPRFRQRLKIPALMPSRTRVADGGGS